MPVTSPQMPPPGSSIHLAPAACRSRTPQRRSDEQVFHLAQSAGQGPSTQSSMCRLCMPTPVPTRVSTAESTPDSTSRCCCPPLAIMFSATANGGGRPCSSAQDAPYRCQSSGMFTTEPDGMPDPVKPDLTPSHDATEALAFDTEGSTRLRRSRTRPRRCREYNPAPRS